MMNQTERALDRFKGGNLKPSAQLRESMEEAERCKIFFINGGFEDYLIGINQEFFNNEGIITDPKFEIQSPASLAEATTIDDDEPEVLELNGESWGGMSTSLEIVRTVEGLKFTDRKITVAFYCSSRQKRFYLELGAYIGEARIKGSIIVSRYIRRGFHLNPQNVGKNFDNFLMEFTGELVDAKII